MAARQSEADRLRQCRLMFETSNREGVPMRKARDLVARRRWQEIEQRRAAQCGKRAPAQDADQQPARPKPWMYAE
ncbi:hypothetical protein [Sphingomonas sp. ERG5]|uniref:hypothetical protein n=1 Tax=Sphingomonas sp. ERG5 TaxID=1381597 RepID=UPI00054C5CFF|nr:hypothetical protein [Sphingomonas sp. ERG5]